MRSLMLAISKHNHKANDVFVKGWAQQTPQQNWGREKKPNIYTNYCQQGSMSSQQVLGHQTASPVEEWSQALPHSRGKNGTPIRTKTKTFLKETTAWSKLAMESCYNHKQRTRPSWTSLKIASFRSQRMWSKKAQRRFLEWVKHSWIIYLSDKSLVSKIESQGWGHGSAGKGPCHQAWQPVFNPQNSHGRRGERISASCLLTHIDMHTVVYVPIQVSASTHRITQINKCDKI